MGSIGENPTETSKVENISSYEREKIVGTLAKAKHLTGVIEIYLKMIDFCDKNGIQINNREMLSDTLTSRPSASADHDVSALSSRFESAITTAARSMTEEQLKDSGAKG